MVDEDTYRQLHVDFRPGRIDVARDLKKIILVERRALFMISEIAMLEESY